MNPGITALIGAAIGAMAGISAALLGNWYQSRMEHQRWIRDKKAEAYASALRSLYRLTNRRSFLLADGTPVLAREHQKEWFDDYIATVEAMGTLSIYAEKEFSRSLYQHAYKLRSEFEAAIAGRISDSAQIEDLGQFRQMTEELEDEIVKSAARDLGLTAKQTG
jgi:hypothetical protein